MNQKAQTKRSFPYVALILWVTVALVVLILGYTLMDTIGVFGLATAGTSSQSNLKLNENNVDVYRYHVAQNQLYYQYMYVQYGLMSDPTGGLIQYMDAETFINYMIPSYVGTEEFDAMAYEYAEQYLTYCEGAHEAKLYDTYKAEVAADIDEYIEGLKTAAKANDISFNSYLTNFIGNGVSEKDVRTAMEYYFIGAKFAEKLTDDYSALVTDEQKAAYRDENKANFFSTTYTSYKLVSNDMKEDIEKCTTVDEVKAVIVDYYMNQKFEDNYKTNFTDKSVEDTAGKDKTKEDVRTTLLALSGVGEKSEVFKSTDTDTYKKAAYAIVKNINSVVSTQMAKVTESTASWADPAGKDATDLQKWLFGDGRKEGDYKLIPTTTTSTSASDGKETTTTTYTWYVVGEDVMALDEEHTKNAYYILLTDDGKDVEAGLTAKKKAELFQAALKETNTPEKFAELVEKYAPGYSAELVEYISYDDLEPTYPDLAKWLYESDRKEGDVSDIFEVKGDSTNKDKVTGCIVSLFVDENEETWKVNATQAIAGEKLTEWYEDAVVRFGVSINYEFETETETTAETK